MNKVSVKLELIFISIFLFNPCLGNEIVVLV